MMSEPFKPFLINDRSSALINFIDASQFTESELVDVYLGMCDRLKHLIELKPTMSFEIPTLDDSYKDAKLGTWVPIDFESFDFSPELTNELARGIIKDCQNTEPLHFEVMPHEAYMILALMQTAIAKLQIPDIENVAEFGKKFIGAFCDRHKENFPNICRSLELGWLPAYQMTRDEFDDLVNDDDEELTVEQYFENNIPFEVPEDWVMPDIPTRFDDDDDDYVDDFA